MKDFQVSNHNLELFIEEIQKELSEEKLLIINSQPAGTGKWGMARLWRAWMATTAKFMAGNGAKMPLMIKQDGSWYGSRPFDANDAHELFTRQWLGVDQDGARLSWAKSGDQRKATKGERFNALRKHEHWCIEKGITLFKPRDSEYEKLEQEQNE
tara:strand:+ start:5009 stop:5473 length:465 start_codon:yes stop_codon:yes gene_type:complete